MTFSVSALKDTMNAMPAKERAAMEDKLLADYARHAAFARPAGIVGLSRLFTVMAGLEESSLALDADIVSATTEAEFAQAMTMRGTPLVLIRRGANITPALITYALERSTVPRTVFIVR